MEVLALQTRVYYIADGYSIPRWNTLQTSILPRWEVFAITNTSILPDGSIHITNTSILPRWKY